MQPSSVCDFADPELAALIEATGATGLDDNMLDSYRLEDELKSGTAEEGSGK